MQHNDRHVAVTEADRSAAEKWYGEEVERAFAGVLARIWSSIASVRISNASQRCRPVDMATATVDVVLR